VPSFDPKQFDNHHVPTEYPKWLDRFTMQSFKFDNPTMNPNVFYNSGYDAPSYSE